MGRRFWSGSVGEVNEACANCSNKAGLGGCVDDESEVLDVLCCVVEGNMVLWEELMPFDGG